MNRINRKEKLFIGILIISFIGIFSVSIFPSPASALPNGDTLILLHGRGDSYTSMNYIYTKASNNNYPVITWEHVYNVEYYGNKVGHPSEFNNLHQGSGIPWVTGATLEQFATALYYWLLGKIFSGQIDRNIYFIGHSMGGLIIRYMVKNYLDYFGGTIRGVATIGTPNHGTIWGDIGAIIYPWETSLRQMSSGSSFIYHLNLNDETPNNARWYTYRGDSSGVSDGVIETWSVPLSGARVNRNYHLNHVELINNWGVYTQIIYDFRYN